MSRRFYYVARTLPLWGKLRAAHNWTHSANIRKWEIITKFDQNLWRAGLALLSSLAAPHREPFPLRVGFKRKEYVLKRIFIIKAPWQINLWEPLYKKLLRVTQEHHILFFLAEREGFEPPEPRSSTVFKTAAIDHSAISPATKVRQFFLLTKYFFNLIMRALNKKYKKSS